MSITKEQIDRLTKKLSKIALEDEKMSSDINAILQYIELLNEVDTTWIRPTINIVDSENTLRKDIEIEKSISTKDLLDCSNQKVIADQIAISNIMK